MYFGLLHLTLFERFLFTVTATSENLGEFLDFLFEGQDGYVYSPTKEPATGYWQPYHFKWPDSRESIITHILRQSRTTDVYISPSLFSEGSGKKEAWKGSQFIWCEFDGNASDANIAEIPPPSLRIQSSTKGHEHWYWRLNTFERNRDVVEGLCRKIAYALGADRSGWDANQVLRPPGTRHHVSSRSVRVVKAKPTKFDISEFAAIKDVPRDEAFEKLVEEIPPVADVVAKYEWPTDAWDLYNKDTQPTGSRSSAMMRLGFHCIEMGMTNEEAYSILRSADDKWKKYTQHYNRTERLLSIIARAKAQKSLQSELLLSDRSELVYTVGEFLDTKVAVEWVYGDMLAKQGLGIISSLPGIGKSQLSLRLAMHAVLQRPFLIWKPGEHRIQKALFLSFEMDRMELTSFLTTMQPSFLTEEWDRIRQQMFLYPQGYSVALDNVKNQDRIKEMVDQYEIDFVLIDSLKAISSNLKEDKMDPIFNFINKDLRSERGTTLWIVHHNRKPGQGEAREPKDVSDLYGDVFISAHATSVFSLWKKSSRVRKVLNLKTRLAEETEGFDIRLSNDWLDWVPQATETESQTEKESESDSGESKFKL